MQAHGLLYNNRRRRDALCIMRDVHPSLLYDVMHTVFNCCCNYESREMRTHGNDPDLHSPWFAKQIVKYVTRQVVYTYLPRNTFLALP